LIYNFYTLQMSSSLDYVASCTRVMLCSIERFPLFTGALVSRPIFCDMLNKCAKKAELA